MIVINYNSHLGKAVPDSKIDVFVTQTISKHALKRAKLKIGLEASAEKKKKEDIHTFSIKPLLEKVLDAPVAPVEVIKQKPKQNKKSKNKKHRKHLHPFFPVLIGNAEVFLAFVEKFESGEISAEDIEFRYFNRPLAIDRNKKKLIENPLVRFNPNQKKQQKGLKHLFNIHEWGQANDIPPAPPHVAHFDIQQNAFVAGDIAAIAALAADVAVADDANF